MEASQFRESLVQTLENFQRCGVSRFTRRDSTDFAQAVLDSLAQLSGSPAQAGPAEPLVAAEVATQPAGAASAPIRAPAHEVAKSQAVVAQPSSAELRWSLPVLQPSQRSESFQALDAQVKACRQCADIVSFRQQTVFGEGSLQPTVCFMGEAPGADEDRQGRPFIGKAGQLLTKIISAMQFTREEVYILNALKCRPPQNRTPVPEEIDQCRGFVESQLEVLQPKYIVCLGAVAVRSILRSTLPIGHLRGSFHPYRGAKVVVTYHPSYLLRNESAKRLVWEDMQMLMRDMGS